MSERTRLCVYQPEPVRCSSVTPFLGSRRARQRAYPIANLGFRRARPHAGPSPGSTTRPWSRRGGRVVDNRSNNPRRPFGPPAPNGVGGGWGGWGGGKGRSGGGARPPVGGGEG